MKRSEIELGVPYAIGGPLYPGQGLVLSTDPWDPSERWAPRDAPLYTHGGTRGTRALVAFAQYGGTDLAAWWDKTGRTFMDGRTEIHVADMRGPLQPVRLETVTLNSIRHTWAQEEADRARRLEHARDADARRNALDNAGRLVADELRELTQVPLGITHTGLGDIHLTNAAATRIIALLRKAQP